MQHKTRKPKSNGQRFAPRPQQRSTMEQERSLNCTINFQNSSRDQHFRAHAQASTACPRVRHGRYLMSRTLSGDAAGFGTVLPHKSLKHSLPHGSSKHVYLAACVRVVMRVVSLFVVCAFRFLCSRTRPAGRADVELTTFTVQVERTTRVRRRRFTADVTTNTPGRVRRRGEQRVGMCAGFM
jgi:hypothetical protein